MTCGSQAKQRFLFFVLFHVLFPSFCTPRTFHHSLLMVHLVTELKKKSFLKQQTHTYTGPVAYKTHHCCVLAFLANQDLFLFFGAIQITFCVMNFMSHLRKKRNESLGGPVCLMKKKIHV